VALPTGVITRYCQGSCNDEHVSSQPLSLALELDGAFAAATLLWWVAAW
jgi:hypothetical protein